MGCRGHYGRTARLCDIALFPTRVAPDYADMLLVRDDEGDHAKAGSLMDECLAISSELGMRPLSERVLDRRKALEA